MSDNIDRELPLEEPSLLPDFCDVRVVFMVVLLIEVLAVVMSLSTIESRVDFWDHLAFISMLLQWIGLINAAVLCLARRFLNNCALRFTLLYSYLLMLGVSLLVALGLIQINHLLALDTITSPIGSDFLLRVMVVSAVIYAVLLRYFYIQYQWHSQLNSQARAEIQALRARIRPHFLFNSMNTIASLIGFRPDDAEKAIVDLSELFRASLMENNSHTLKDEIGITRSYLDIEKLRLGDRLQINWSLDNSLLDEEIPSLCLQPLAENAIYHGIEPLMSGGTIEITAHQEGETLVMCVTNPVSDRSDMPHKKGNRMAQQNIRQRLELAYGKRADFQTNETKHSYSVQLRIPLERVL